MKASIPFGAWTPDLANHGHAGLITCENVLAVANGYAPVKAFTAVADALTGWSGGGSFIQSSGATVILGGTSAGLYNLLGGAWTSAHAVAASGRWRFSQHGDIVVATHGGAPVAYDLVAGTGGALGGSPPDAKYSATVGNFTFLAGDPNDVRTLTWSGFGNPEAWTIGTNQCGSQTLPDGGDITGLAGGEFGLVFQRGGVFRYDYIGGDTVWQRTKISTEIGCMVPDSIAQAGSIVYFLSERGFMRTDGNEVVPIGAERVDRTFLDAYDRAELADMYAAVDPRNTMVMWLMPGSPGVGYAYNWTLDRWTTIEVANSGVISALSSYVSVDQLAGLTDDYATLTDDPDYAGGVPLLFVVSASGVIGTLSGSNLAVTIKTAFNELAPGQRTRPYRIGLVSDAVSGVTVTTDSRMRLGDSASTVSIATMRTNGDLPLRANGRYHTFETVIAAATTWTFMQGLEVEFGNGGRR